MSRSLYFLLFLTIGLSWLSAEGSQSLPAPMLCSTACDPDAIIDKCVNTINGDYCETSTDLIIAGPDPLILQRFHNSKNYVTSQGYGGWRLLPQITLVLGKDPQKKECKVRGERFEQTYAFTGERSGSILTYTGWKRIDGDTKDPLKINAQESIGLVNTYAAEINGQTNHLNNRLHCQGDTCILILGDGTKRLYQKTAFPPDSLFNQGLYQDLAAKVIHPIFYQLISETLPSGNQILFSYDDTGELTAIEVQSPSQKTHSWIRIHTDRNTITLETSDSRTLQYRFEQQDTFLVLKEISGSHCIPCSYDYQASGKTCSLTRKSLPEGRFLEIEYDSQGRVITLKKPHPETGNPFIAKQFHYGNGYTDVFNAAHIKTRYSYDEREQLTTLNYCNESGQTQRIDRKYYGNTKKDLTYLNARTIADGFGRIFSYRTFTYDDAGNVLEEKPYGNLTGKEDPYLIVDDKGLLLNPDEAECHTKTFTYSQEGFNLITSLGDCKGNQTFYHYKEGTNLLTKKYIRDENSIHNREFRCYNADGICIKKIEDDGSEEEWDDLWNVKERHITYTQPKTDFPGIGLPEIIEEKALDLTAKQETLVKKLVNTHSPQGHLLSCATYGSNGTYGYTVSKTYNRLGQILTETDPEGKTTTYTYNACGDQILISIPHEQKSLEKQYDRLGRVTAIIEKAGELTAEEHYTYDLLDRKTSSRDRFGNLTSYTYNAFDRLVQVTHPIVSDEYGNQVSPTFFYTYDIFGNTITITDPKGYTTRKSYNLRGDPSHIYYPDGSSELFKYDPEGSLHRSLTRDRLITVYEYDYLGRPIYEEVMTASENGASSFHKSRSHSYNGFRCTSFREDQHVTDYTYDPSGRAIEVMQHKSGKGEKHPDTRKTEIIYDPLGCKSQEKIWFDTGPDDYSLTCFTYDFMGNLVEKRVEDAQGKTLLQKTFEYDNSGRCIKEADEQTCLETHYDPFGEPIAYINAAGNTTEIVIDYSGPLRKAIINPLGLITEMEFDALGRLVLMIKKDSEGVLLSSKRILYDGVGNKSIEQNGVVIEGQLQGVQTTHWIYGPMGRLEILIEAEGTPEEKTTTYTYNNLGQLLFQTLPGAANPLTYTYNKTGHLYKVHYEDPDKELCISNRYSYDRQGNITSAHALYGISVQRECNIYGQVIKETINDGEGSYSLDCQYDRKGRLKEVKLPDDSSIRYTYDALFGREAIRLSADGSEVYKHVYSTYDTSGRIHEETLIGYSGNRLTEYDAMGCPSHVSTDYIAEDRSYDALGHLLSVLKEAEFETSDASYVYNALSQLMEDNQNHYTYDSVDNRLKKNNETLVSNSLNQLIRAGRTEYSYDPLGNLKRKILDREETVFIHNILSQLVSIKKPDKTALYFSYDPFGRRLTKKHCDISGKYKKTFSLSRSFYLGNHELGELDRRGHITKLRVPGLNGETLSLKSIIIELSDHVYAPLHDHAGNLIALLDPDSREIVESYTYSAFGRETIYVEGIEVARSTIGNPWRFADKPIDEESGLIYFGLRYYDPAIGRWISQDSSREDGPNFYAYLHNNPINYIDHFGLETDEFEEYYYGDVEKHCYCETHRTCKRGGDLDKTVNGLPKVTYCDDFERNTPYPTGGIPYLPIDHGPSRIGETGGRIAVDIGIGFINGIWNTFESAQASAEYLSRLSGGYNVHFVYNATQGLRDASEYFMGLRHIATEPVG